MATVCPCANFDKDQDCQVLRKAMKGIGTDERAIIDILGKRSTEQRLELVVQYKTAYGRDLIKDLKSELSGDFESTVIALIQPRAVYDALCLKKAMKGLGTDEDILIEIMCSRSNEEINDIKEAYRKVCKGELEKALASETSGDFKRILIGLCQGARNEDPTIDEGNVLKDAEALQKAAKGLGTDESEFQRILVARNKEHLKAVFIAYEKLGGKSIESTIKSEMSGELQRAYLTIVTFFKHPIAFYATLLNKAIRGLGTDEQALIRIIVSRAEIDLSLIKIAYHELFGKSFPDDLKGDTSGDFRKLLLELVGP